MTLKSCRQNTYLRRSRSCQEALARQALVKKLSKKYLNALGDLWMPCPGTVFNNDDATNQCGGPLKLHTMYKEKDAKTEIWR